MPAHVKSINNMSKHLSKAEIEARTDAESMPVRKLRKPKQITQDKAAARHWKETVQDLEGLNIIDRADSDTLAAYCEILARIDGMRESEKHLKEKWENSHDLATYKALSNTQRDIMSIQAQQLTFATKLGLTPEARARLAKRKAETEENDPDKDLFA